MSFPNGAMTVTKMTTAASPAMPRLTSSSGPENSPALCMMPAFCTLIRVVVHMMSKSTSAAAVSAIL